MRLHIGTAVFLATLLCSAWGSDPPDAEAYVDEHNAWRREVGVPDLAWDQEIAGIAQAYADTLQASGCDMVHNPDLGSVYGGGRLGENLYWSWGWPTVSFEPYDSMSSWAGEKPNYNYGPVGNGCTQTDPSIDVGHYTQMVWSSTRYLGCGTAVCPVCPIGDLDGQCVINVCNYFPTGNMIGWMPFCSDTLPDGMNSCVPLSGTAPTDCEEPCGTCGNDENPLCCSCDSNPNVCSDTPPDGSTIVIQRPPSADGFVTNALTAPYWNGLAPMLYAAGTLTGGRAVSLLEWSDLPPAEQITQVSLRLFKEAQLNLAGSCSPDSRYKLSAGSGDVTDAAVRSWAFASPRIEHQFPGTDTLGELSADVTTMVKEALAGTPGTLSLLLEATEDGCQARFGAKEGSNAPLLTVEYTDPSRRTGSAPALANRKQSPPQPSSATEAKPQDEVSDMLLSKALENKDGLAEELEPRAQQWGEPSQVVKKAVGPSLVVDA